MALDLHLPLSMTFGIAVWSLIFYLYVHPYLRHQPVSTAIEPLLLLHSFRYLGMMFLVPGVTSEVLDARFANPAAYGDLIAAILALFAIAALRRQVRWALPAVWVFNVWGLADLINAVARGIAYVPDGHFGAAYWIPAAIVPLLLVTHGYIFILLVGEIKARGQSVTS